MDKMRQWSLLTGLAVVGVLAAGWFLMVSPQRSHANELRGQAASKQQSTAGLLTQVAQLKQQAKDKPAQQRTLMKIATQIPDNPQLPTLIRELTAAAHDAGVSLQSLSPSAPTLVTATAAGTTTTAGAAASAAPLAQIPVTLQVTGSYFNVESFFRSVEHLDRAMMVVGFSVGPGSSGGSTGATTGTSSGSDASAVPGALNAQIQAVVFESPTVAPATTGTQPTTAQATTPQTTSTQAPATPASTAPSAAPAQ